MLCDRSSLKRKAFIDDDDDSSDILSYFKDEADKAGSTLLEISGKKASHLLIDMVTSNTSISGLLTEKQRVFVDSVIEACWHLQVDNFKIRDFAALICSVDSLPIELIWRLHRSRILDVISYLSCVPSCSLLDVANHLTASLTQLLCGHTKEPGIVTNIICDICSALILCSFATSTSSSEQHLGTVKKVSGQILNTLMTNVLDSIRSCKDNLSYRLVMFAAVRTAGILDSEIQQKFCIQQLMLIIGYCPVSKVFETVSMQNQWSFLRSPCYLVNIFIQLLIPLTTNRVMSFLRQTLETPDINWHTFLTFVSTSVVLCSDAKPEFEVLITDILRKAIENNDHDAVLASFLMVRQAALEGTSVFPSYAEWFRASFSRSSDTLASNKTTFTFFVEFLTKLVPFEPAIYLQVHISNPPHTPNKCRVILYDYICLAKARLAELEVNINEIRKTSEEQQAVAEVEESIQLFSKTQKIPPNIIEAWMFHKAYYLHSFLPELLKPSKSHNPSDQRMKFIEALYKSGKIPSVMYADYTKENTSRS